MIELSVLIPARQERYLKHTVEDVIAHSSDRTEVIVVLDGEWPNPPLAQHPRVKIVRVPTVIGQRAAVNLAARLSSARYIMKLDAHCSVAPNFDEELIRTGDELGPDVTQIPAQKNLHVFDWVCTACGNRAYQANGQPVCARCSSPTQEELVWQPKRGSTTTCWVFDSEPHFKYDKVGQRAQEGEICDVMSSLGACFFMDRERFWSLGGLDEAHGSWGQFGIEIACKSWLSGGRHVVNKRTWFAHWFRVGMLTFPYPMSGTDQARARDYSRQLWFNNAWPQQVRSLQWLIQKFSPPGWTADDIAKLAPLRAEPSLTVSVPAPLHSRVTCVYYSDNRGDERVLHAVQVQLARMNLPVVSVTLKPTPFGQNIVLPLERGYLTMFKQILAGLEAADTEVVFLTEHDVLYHPSHFEFVPPRQDTVYYNQHVYKVDAATGRALHYLCSQTSGLCANRKLLIEHYHRRIERVEREGGYTRNMGFEPGTRKIRHGGIDDLPSATWMSPQPNVDIRHAQNLTPSRWRKDQFRNQRYTAGWTEADGVPGWGLTLGRFDAWLQGVIDGEPREPRR